MLWRAFAVWLLIVAAEILHGAARTLLLEPWIGDFRARQIAVFTGSAIILAIACWSIRWIGARTPSQLWTVGLFWLALTLGFELAFGRLVMGYSWRRLAADYNLLDGGLLPIGMLFLILAPTLARSWRFRGSSRAP